MASVISGIDVKLVTPTLGGVVEGVDLAKPLDSSTVAQVRTALLERGMWRAVGCDPNI